VKGKGWVMKCSDVKLTYFIVFHEVTAKEKNPLGSHGCCQEYRRLARVWSYGRRKIISILFYRNQIK
jgi:hypothetical protein